MRNTKKASRNSKLSDADLLIVPHLNELQDYIVHLRQAIDLSAHLNQHEGQLVEFFLLSSRIVDVYYNCLSVMLGDNTIREEDIVFGPGRHHKKDKKLIIPIDSCRQNLYIAKAAAFCSGYTQALPLADTSQARKVAKNLLQGLKFVICANTEIDLFDFIEQKLFSVNSFEELMPIFVSVTSIDVTIDDIIQRVLAGESVDDWPAWMIAQDTIARQLMEFEVDKGQDINERRLYGAMCEVRDMLIVGLKNIISERDEEVRLRLIGQYADQTASNVIKLALAGVDSLADFEGADTPGEVLKSYQVLVGHLKEEERSMRCLAASVTLLEYAIEQSILKANDQFEIGS